MDVQAVEIDVGSALHVSRPGALEAVSVGGRVARGTWLTGGFEASLGGPWWGRETFGARFVIVAVPFARGDLAADCGGELGLVSWRDPQPFLGLAASADIGLGWRREAFGFRLGLASAFPTDLLGTASLVLTFPRGDGT